MIEPGRPSASPARGVFACVLALLLVAAARPASGQLATLETPTLRLVYFDGTESYLAPYATQTFLNSLEFQRRLFGFESTDPISVLLADFADAGNAGASVVPRNSVSVQIAPLSFAFETIAGNERLNLIMNHELVHIATMDQAASSDRFFRRLFGGKVNPVADSPESILYFFLTTPRVAAPRWYHEGIAVFVDTWMAGGLGRAQGGYDEMVFRSMVRDGATFYDPLGLVSEGTKIDFQLQINSYLYGTRFMTWLARTYSPAQLIEWVSRRPGSRAYYAAQFERVFGQRLEQAWARWVRDEQAFQRANLAAVRAYPVTKATDLTTRALGSISRAYFDPSAGRLYAAFNYPGRVAHVGAIDVASGAIEHLVDVKGPVIYAVASLTRNPRTGLLFYTTDNGAYRDLVQLDPATRRTRVLQKDLRVGDLAFNRQDESLWGVRHLNGLCTLVRIPPPYTEWEQVHTFPYGTVLYDLDVSPDGSRLAASVAEISGKQDVRVFSIADLRRGVVEPAMRFDFGTAVPNGFVFSPDGRYLYGSSYYTGVSNIFRYDLTAREVEAVSNTDTGFFRPIPLADGSLIVFRYTGAGFVPAKIAAEPVTDIAPITFLGQKLVEERPELETWNVGSPARIDVASLHQRPGRYRLSGRLRRESLYPVVQGYKDTWAIGARYTLSDPLQLNRAVLQAAVSPDASLPASERIHLDAEYRRYDWRARAALNGADFYDLFGPTKTSRKGYAVSVGHTNTLVFDEPRHLELDLSGTLAGNLDRLPDYQNVPVDVNTLVTLDARLSYRDVRSSLGSVDDETGSRWTAAAKGHLVDGTFVPKVFGTWDRGLGMPLPHSSVWWRSAAGYSPRDRSLPFANFYFGGFGNNWVDHQEEKRYREYYAMPGLGLNEVGGRTFVKSTLEWNLPPARFSRAGTPGFYASWLRPAVFATGLVTDVDARAVRREILTTGGQIDLRLSVLSTLDLTVSLGAGIALERSRPPQGEAMVSLRILR